ncbi:MAG: serine/threonine protein phosphatase, partial [Acutalibacteraceae bacterium]|nr:serine/threonine protein phosphatase [Acutalibacteraceae bacterium]
HIECSKNSHTLALQSFLKNVSVGGNQQGIEAFVATYLEQLLTYGTAVGEIVTDSHGRFAALYNADLEDIELRRGDDGISAVVCVKNFYETTPVEYPELVALSVLNPEAGQLCGNSIMKGLPFVSNILMKIYNTIGINWERVGNVRFAVTYKPQNDVMDRAYAKDRAQQVAREWSEAMQSGKQIRDFVAVGDVSIKAIGADNQILDSEVPVRQMLEQIVAKTGIPPFMLGLSWSSTERMSSQQADVLTSELEAYRRILTPVIEKISRFWLISNGIQDKAEVVWDDITLQDEVELSKAALYRAQTKRIEQELTKNE